MHGLSQIVAMNLNTSKTFPSFEEALERVKNMPNGSSVEYDHYLHIATDKEGNLFYGSDIYRGDKSEGWFKPRFNHMFNWHKNF